MPAHEAGVAPWHEVATDMTGPWTILVNGQSHAFRALTIIDTVSNITEIICINCNATAMHTAQQFEMAWLSRYPRPIHCIYDQEGPEFGHHFKQIHKQPLFVNDYILQLATFCEL